VLTQRSGFLQYADLDIAECSTGFRVMFDELRECDSAGKARWSPTDEKHVHRNSFGVRRLRQDQSIEREWCLVPPRQHSSSAIGH
jgi:hypothetical protein